MGNHKTGQATEQPGLSTQQAATDRTQPKIGLTRREYPTGCETIGSTASLPTRADLSKKSPGSDLLTGRGKSQPFQGKATQEPRSTSD